MNTLCFDFGNTRLKVALFQNAKLAEVIVIENDREGNDRIIVKRI